MRVVGTPWWRRALTGSLVGIFALLLLIPIALVVWVMLQAHDAREGIRAQLDDLSLGTLRPGECVDEIGDADNRTLRRASCASSHDGEITGVVALTGGGYPGKDQVIKESDHLCATATANWILDGPGADMDLDLGFFYPSLEGWVPDRPTTICYAVASSGKRIRGPLGAVR